MRPFALTAALLCLLAPAARAAVAPTACQLLSAAEVAKALGAAVTIDQSASGPDGTGGDNCVWVTADHRNIMIRVIPVADPNFVDYTFKSEVSNAFSNGKPPERLGGVGEEARYRAYTGNLSGGVIVAKKGKTIFVVEGRTTRDNLAGLAKTVAGKV